MSPLWSWRPRPTAHGRPTAASPRPSHFSRVGFDTLEDRLAPSVAAAANSAWRAQRFHVDDMVVKSAMPVATAAAAKYANQSFGSLIGLDQVFANSPYRGAGASVAVIDTG